jgi:hypothetical protein
MAVSRLGVVNYIQMYMRVARGWPWSLTPNSTKAER